MKQFWLKNQKNKEVCLEGKPTHFYGFLDEIANYSVNSYYATGLLNNN